MREAALERLRDTFFGGSTEQTVSALLNLSDQQLSGDELRRSAELSAQAQENESHGSQP